METIAKDLAARIATFETNHGEIETPTIFPVVHARDPIVSLKEIKKMGVEGVIANAYMLWKNNREEVLNKGIHRLLNWKGTVMTDSGAFQLMQYGNIEVNNKEIIEFQDAIKVDIGVPLDIPGLGPKERVKKNCALTLQRAKEAKELTQNSNSLWAGPVQGAQYIDLRKKCARDMGKLDFDIYPIGSVVPLMNNYEFALNIDIISAVKQNLPLNKPVHHFGNGHCTFLSFAVAMGADIFDSAAYSLFAKRGDYMTVSGTQAIADMDYLPCSCPACKGKNPTDLDTQALARHNLHATFNEINKIKQSIREQTLWELLEERARGHPALYAAFQRMKKHQKYLESLDPYTKKRFFYLSKESENRVELYRHKKTKCSSKEYIDAFPFKKVPCEIVERYPFGQRILPFDDPIKACGSALEKANTLSEYQFGVRLFPKNSKVKVAKTRRIRSVTKDGELLAAFRASDLVCIPHESAKPLHKKTKDWRVVVQQDTAEFPATGKNVFAKFVKKVDPRIRQGMEVLIVDEKDNLLAEGKAMLSAKEMLDFDSGVAVKTRKGFK